MEMDRDYYRTKSASLEEGYLHLQRENDRLLKENQALKTTNDGLTGTIVHHRDICPDDSCEDFELIGRLSR